MRLPELLSKVPAARTAQVEGFLGGKSLGWGKHKRIRAGKVFHNFHCQKCGDQRTFVSGEELDCLGLGDDQVSIDVTLRCAECKSSVEAWFLVASEGSIAGPAPQVRVERYTENLRDRAERVGETGGAFSDLVKRANLAYENDLGAGAIIYIRKIFELITWEVAEIAGIPTERKSGKRRPFFDVLRDVNDERKIIPQRFSSDGYQLFSELSEIIHGESSEKVALQKYEPCLRLVLGVVEEVNRDNVFAKAIEDLGWNVENIDEIAREEGVA